MASFATKSGPGVHTPDRRAETTTVSAAELRRNFGLWQQRAFAEPILIARHGKANLVLSSARQFFGEGQDQDELSEAVQAAIAALPAHSQSAFIALDRDLRIVAANNLVEDGVRRPISDLIGRLWEDVFPNSVNSAVGIHLRLVLQTSETVRFESTSHDGLRHYDCSVFPHAHGVAALLTNRTVEHAAREEVARARSLAAAMGALGKLAHLTLNIRGVIETASPQFKVIAGLDPVDTVHKTRFSDLLRLSDRQAATDALESVLSEGRTLAFRATLLSANGDSRPVEIALAPIWRNAVTEGATAVLKLKTADR